MSCLFAIERLDLSNGDVLKTGGKLARDSGPHSGQVDNYQKYTSKEQPVW